MSWWFLNKLVLAKGNFLMGLKYSALYILILVTGLSGCVGFLPGKLEKADEYNSIELSEEYVFSAKYGTGVEYEYTLISGVYNVVGKDSKGVYYKGPRGCLEMKVVETSWVLKEEFKGKYLDSKDGGVFIPFDPKKHAMAFSIIGTEVDRSLVLAENDTSSAAVALSQSRQGANGSPVQSGVGVGLGVGIASALAEAEKGRFQFVPKQIVSESLRDRLRETVAPSDSKR
ncbi:hypothetical protein KFE80_08880 [bacterium SCSIO 12696]|nr:hypothetical protein KFE80_08880 [bacterium SCSIO 12696]